MTMTVSETPADQDLSVMNDWIAKLVASGESESLEFKRTTGTRREAVRSVCAMLNQDGGRVLFGVTRKGEVVGQQVSEQNIEKLNAEFQRIEPQVFPKIERIPVADDRELIGSSRVGSS